MPTFTALTTLTGRTPAYALGEAMEGLIPEPTGVGVFEVEDGSGLWEVGGYFEAAPDTAALAVLAAAFDLEGQGADVLNAFAVIGVGGFIFFGALFVSNAAFNNLGKPGRSTLVNWIKDGVIAMPAALWFAGIFGAAGVIYGQAAAGIAVGAVSATWGWFYVKGLRVDAVPLDPAPAAPYPNPDRHRSR